LLVVGQDYDDDSEDADTGRDGDVNGKKDGLPKIKREVSLSIPRLRNNPPQPLAPPSQLLSTSSTLRSKIDNIIDSVSFFEQ